MATEVSNQLDRIEDGKESIVTSIENKGVAVPDDAKIDELAPYIDAIKTGVLQSKSVIPFTTEQTVTPDDGYDGLSSVTVGAIPSFYVNTKSGDATASDILKGKKAWVDGKEITGDIETYDEQAYTVSLEHPIVLIDDGYHNSSTAQIIREKEKTVTPSTSDITVSPTSGRVLSTVKVLGDNNLVASNIKEGASIFGVAGTFKGGANIATCTVNIQWSITTRYALITATTFANGAISVFTSNTGSGTVTIPNVVCGSVVTVYTGTMTSVYGWSYGKAYSQDSYTHALTIPTSTGTYTAEIGVLDD